MQHDRLVLSLLWADARAAVRGLRKRDLAWLILGGGALFTYGVADIVSALQTHAVTLRQAHAIWTIGLPISAVISGALIGLAASSVATTKAFSPFLRPLPLPSNARHRAILFVAAAVGVISTLIAAALADFAGTLVAIDAPIASELRVAVAFAIGFTAMVLRNSARVRSLVFDAAPARERGAGFHLRWLDFLDRTPPRWLNSWAWRLPAGRVPIVAAWLAMVIVLIVAAVLAIVASFVTHHAIPAASVATAGGVAMFMLTVRCHPLELPVLRTSPIGFTRAWLRLMRIPLLLSAVFFSLPASAAVAADPLAWTTPIGGGFVLLVLNAAYGVFAAYFATAPIAAAISFASAFAYAYYESFEYGRGVAFGLIGLIALLWHRAHRRYRNG